MIGTNRLKDQSVTAPKLAPGSVTQDKLAGDALRPTDEGVLTDPALVFGTDYRKKFSLTITEDIPLSLSGSSQTADSYIFITTIPDGTHHVSFPGNWIIKSGEFDPTKTQRIELYYDGLSVYVDVFNSTAIIIPSLVTAIMDEGTDDLTLTFDNAVTITTSGWSVTASGGAATVSSVVSGSGTPVVVFDLSRNITSGEMMTVSYNPSTGNTVSSTGNELEVISNFIVDTGEGAEPPAEFCDITVCATGGDYTTWQAASNAAVAGQTICGCAGTYRETIVGKTGVTYRNIPGETAIISGLTEAGNTGWTVHSGSIYKKTIALPITGFASTITSNTSLLANQIFKDGVMQFQARYPNITALADLLDRDKFRHHTSVSSWGQTSITDAGLPDFNLTGGSVFITGWFIAQTRTITGGNGSSVISYAATDQNSKFRRWYYVTNDLDLLDAEKEWHYEGGILYFRQTGGGSPTGVEFKSRNWGFDLRGKSNVNIIGLHFKGCEPATGDGNTNSCTIDNIRVTYQNHAFMQVDPDQIYNSPKQNGIKLLGTGNTIKNSEFQYAASQVIWGAEGMLIENNLASDISYEGNYGAFVTPWPGADNIRILRNTVSRVGRSAIDFGWEDDGNHFNIEIGYNDFHTYLMLSNDGGCLYAARGINLNGTRIHHNWIHDNVIGLDWDGAQGAADYDGIHVNIYFDQGTGPTTVDHNVLWNGGVADYYSQVISTTQNIYNNTFAHDGRRESYIVAQSSPHDVLRNNIFTNTVNVNWGGSIGNVAYSIVPSSHTAFNNNNNILTNSPLFVGPLETGAGYQLQAGSPARNTGTVIAGITDDDDSSPDMGAYKYGAPWATPGYEESATATDYIIDNEDATYTGAGWQHFTGQTWTPPPTNSVSFSPTLGAFLEAEFTGTEVKLYAEKRFNQGIVEVEIDGVRKDCDPVTGGTQDCDLYDARTDNNLTLIGTWTVSAGAHDIKIELVGENAAADNSPSPHANIIFDYLEITP